MQTISSRWEAAIRAGAQHAIWRVKIEIYSYYRELLASTEETIGAYPRLLVDDGEVHVDGAASIRRSAQITFIDPDGTFAPAGPNALLSNTSGNEIKIWAGFRYSNGSEELVPLGVFGFADDDTETSGGDQTVEVSLFDRARRVKRSGFVLPYQIGVGVNYVEAISALIRSRWADAVINATPTIFTTPKLTFDEKDDPWETARDMAAKIGYDCYFDVYGEVQLQPILRPTVLTPATFEYTETPDSVLLGASRRSSNEQGFNGVIMTGASSSNVGVPPRGEAWDTDPQSPTYSGYDPILKWWGPTPYGAVPKFEQSSLLTTSAQCATAAEAELQKLIGRHENVEFDALPNPAHEAFDLVHVSRARAKIDAMYELQAFNIPLRVQNTMRAVTKERRVT